MKPAVSVVMPTYNCGRYLAEAVRSVLGQTFGDLELLIVDDGSTDDTASVIAQFLGDARVRWFRQPNRGPAAARNLGIRQARGQWVAFLDADDRWLNDKLEKQIALFRSQPKLGLVYTRRLLIDGDGWALPYRQPRLYRGDVLPQLFRDNFICFSSAVVRRDVLVWLGGFDTTVEHSEDYELLLRLTADYEVDYVDEPLVLYRTGHGNLSSQTEKRYRAVCGIMSRFLRGGGEELLPASLVRRAWAETYSHWGIACRDYGVRRAAGRFARALAHRPHHGEAWRGLATLCVPKPGRRWLRRLLRRANKIEPRASASGSAVPAR